MVSAKPLTDFRRWSVVTMLCAVFVCAYFDRQNLSIALASPDFKHLFRLNDTGRGLLNSAFFWTYALLQLPAGWFVDRFGVKRPFAAGLVIWSLVSAATAWCGSFAALFAVRLLLGAGEAVNTPAAMRWIRLNFKGERHGFVMGLYQASAKVGPALGAPLIAFLLAAYGWRVMFLVIGLGALVWLLPWLLLANDDRGAPVATTQGPGSIGEQSFGDLFRTRALWGTMIGSFCYNYFNYFCLTWLPAYFLESRGLSLQSTGWFTAYSFWGFAVVATLSGLWADAIVRRGGDAIRVRKTFIIAGFLIATTEMVGAASPSNNVALFFAIFSLTGLGLATGNYWAITPAILPHAPPARLAGIQNMSANLPGVVAPLVTGWLKQVTGTYTAPMAMNLVFLGVGIASYLFLMPRSNLCRTTDNSANSSVNNESMSRS